MTLRAHPSSIAPAVAVSACLLLVQGRAMADAAAGARVAAARCVSCRAFRGQGTNAGAARLAGQKERYTAWSLQSSSLRIHEER